MEAFLQNLIAKKMRAEAEAAGGGGGGENEPPSPPPQEPVVSSFDLAGVAELIREGKAKNVIVMAGAGISVAAGIPDFRTPGTGLYDNLQKYNLPEPTAVFDIEFFREHPAPFYMLARELFPGQYRPTPTHHFIRMLHDKGILRRCFTQNIDSLESQAGLPKEMCVAAHGNFDGATCISTGEAVPVEEVKDAIFSDDPGSGWEALRDRYGGLVKPNITFFGEKLPERFYQLSGIEQGMPSPFGVDEPVSEADFPNCDLLIVMGTSLSVRPFSMLVDLVPPGCPRVLINREAPPSALYNPIMSRITGDDRGFRFDETSNYRDVLHIANCDDGVVELARLCGWDSDLEALVMAGGGWPPPLDPPPPRVKPQRDISSSTQAHVASVLQRLMMGGGGGGMGGLGNDEDDEGCDGELDPRDHFRSLDDALHGRVAVGLLGGGGGDAEKEAAILLGKALGEGRLRDEGVVVVTGGMPGPQDEFGTAYADAVEAGGGGAGCFMALPTRAFDQPEEYGLPEGFWGWAGCGETVVCGTESSALGVVEASSVVVLMGLADSKVVRGAISGGVPVVALGAGRLMDEMLDDTVVDAEEEGIGSSRGGKTSLTESEVRGLITCPPGVLVHDWDCVINWPRGVGDQTDALCRILDVLAVKKEKQAADLVMRGAAESPGGDEDDVQFPEHAGCGRGSDGSDEDDGGGGGDGDEDERMMGMTDEFGYLSSSEEVQRGGGRLAEAEDDGFANKQNMGQVGSMASTMSMSPVDHPVMMQQQEGGEAAGKGEGLGGGGMDGLDQIVDQYGASDGQGAHQCEVDR